MALVTRESGRRQREGGAQAVREVQVERGGPGLVGEGRCGAQGSPHRAGLIGGGAAWREIGVEWRMAGGQDDRGLQVPADNVGHWVVHYVSRPGGHH